MVSSAIWLHGVAMSKTRDPRPATGHIPPFGLRMQPDLKARLEESATAAGRSLNAEIVSRLEASFQAPDPNSVTAVRTAEGVVSAEKLAAMIAANLTQGLKIGGTLLTGYDLEQEADEPGEG